MSKLHPLRRRHCINDGFTRRGIKDARRTWQGKQSRRSEDEHQEDKNDAQLICSTRPGDRWYNTVGRRWRIRILRTSHQYIERVEARYRTTTTNRMGRLQLHLYRYRRSSRFHSTHNTLVPLSPPPLPHPLLWSETWSLNKGLAEQLRIDQTSLERRLVSCTIRQQIANYIAKTLDRCQVWRIHSSSLLNRNINGPDTSQDVQTAGVTSRF